jgi:hypothetical protein
MRDYRVYLLDKDDHIVDAHVIRADSDQKAVEAAKQYVDGCNVEVWDGARKIARLVRP